MTPAMLQRARNSAAEAGVDNIDFRHGYGVALRVLLRFAGARGGGAVVSRGG